MLELESTTKAVISLTQGLIIFIYVGPISATHHGATGAHPLKFAPLKKNPFGLSPPRHLKKTAADGPANFLHNQ
jgi:hypothetical protein